MYGVVGIILYKLFKACKDLRIVSGRDLIEFPHCDQIIIKRCLQMSSIAYETLTEDSKCLKINEKDFDDLFRSCPTKKEHDDNHKGRFKMKILLVSFYCLSLT